MKGITIVAFIAVAVTLKAVSALSKAPPPCFGVECPKYQYCCPSNGQCCFYTSIGGSKCCPQIKKCTEYSCPKGQYCCESNGKCCPTNQVGFPECCPQIWATAPPSPVQCGDMICPAGSYCNECTTPWSCCKLSIGRYNRCWRVQFLQVPTAKCAHVIEWVSTVSLLTALM